MRVFLPFKLVFLFCVCHVASSAHLQKTPQDEPHLNWKKPDFHTCLHVSSAAHLKNIQRDVCLYMPDRGDLNGFESVRVLCTSRASILYYQAQPRHSDIAPRIYYCQLQEDKELGAGPLAVARAFSQSGVSSLDEFLSQKFSSPTRDIKCAVITELKRWLSKEVFLEGVLHPDFESWARYMPSSDVYSSDKVIFPRICENKYGKGSVWIRREDDKNLLCYVPDFGPTWMCYYYDLGCSHEWPENWHSLLVFLQDFAQRIGVSFTEYFSSQHKNVVCVIKAVFSGRAELWSQQKWCTWRPRSDDIDPFLLVEESHELLRGSVDNHFYQKGSVWTAPGRHGTKILRYRLDNGAIFQFAQPITQKNVYPSGCNDLCSDMQALDTRWPEVIDKFMRAEFF